MVTIRVKSPIHLSSGRGDVNIDSDIVHDSLGLPYFPARRFKGLLYESAVEVAEMMELSGLNIVTRDSVETLFHHKGTSAVNMVIHDIHLPEYEQIVYEWLNLQREFADVVRPEEVLESYTSWRTQTALDDNGVAKEKSLRTIRVLDLEDVSFKGEIVLHGGDEYVTVLALALKNLTSAGGHRHRGFGKIECTMERQDKIIEECLSGVE